MKFNQVFALNLLLLLILTHTHVNVYAQAQRQNVNQNNADQQKQAIIIGVSQKDQNLGIEKLPGVEYDMEKIGRQFSQRGFQVTFMQNPTKRVIMDKLSVLQADLRELVFYYSGHGVDANETGFLVPVISAATGQLTKQAAQDENLNLFTLPALRNELISADELHQAFKTTAAEKLLVIFDTNTQNMCRPTVFSASLRAAHFYCAGPRAVAALKGGIFTSLMDKGLGGEADKNKDDVVDALELETFTKQQLLSTLKARGFPAPEPAYFHFGEMQFRVLPMQTD